MRSQPRRLPLLQRTLAIEGDGRRELRPEVTVLQTLPERLVETLRRANTVAAAPDLESLLEGTLGLLAECVGSETGWMALYNEELDELRVAYRLPDRLTVPRSQINALVDQALQQQRLMIDDALVVLPFCDGCMPMPVVILEAVGLDSERLMFLTLVAERLSSEIARAQRIAQARQREERQQALLEIIAQLTTTLKTNDLLDTILDRGRDLLGVEASSIWLRDSFTNELHLHLAAGDEGNQMTSVRIPAGHGVIGYVVETGETVVVNDTRTDPRFYRQVDARSGFTTRAILCVPLRAPHIRLGGERGEVAEAIIGGMQALNPRSGEPFNAEDIAIFEMLASQAATIVRLSQLYDETDRLFSRIIDAITGAIDMKDPYTRGHSQRVSDFSVAIAQELKLSPEFIYRVRIASKLHDVGKIRIPDRVLKKRSHLTERERQIIQQHPAYGLDFLRENGLLELELMRDAWQALAQHHERLDGGGYPHGLKGESISLIGRIVAVADVFDAVTSDRPYRPALPSAQAIQILQDGAGTEFDAECVGALIRAREKGLIAVQAEREESL